MTIDLEQKFTGGLLGTALGDAIGELAFRWSQADRLRQKVTESDKLVYTDDTAMALGLAESLVAQGRIDAQHLGDTFRENYEREPWRGYASGPPNLFRRVKREGIPYTEAAGDLFGGQGSYGSGAAMRIVPVGLFFHQRQTADLLEQARASAQVTHAHPIAQDGAAILALAQAQAVRLDPAEPFAARPFSQALIEAARTDEIRQKMEMVQQFIEEGTPPNQAAGRLGRGVAMHKSMPFAVYAFLREPDSFAECLFCAALHGGDADTLGAMACGISGAYLGREALPAEWLDRLENRAAIEKLALDLLARASS